VSTSGQRLRSAIIQRIAGSDDPHAGFAPDPRYSAGRVNLPGGPGTALDADAEIELVLVEAIVTAAVGAKTVRLVVDRLAAKMEHYVKSGAFERRLNARVEQVLDALLDSVAPSDGEKLVELKIGELEASVRELLAAKVEAGWRSRVEDESKRLLDEALARVRADYSGRPR
jgi:hypothetical protein